MTSNCERDDICAASTPTTPNVNVTFFDISLEDTEKVVNGLRVAAEGIEKPIDLSSNSRLSLPLLFNEENVPTTTRFLVTRDSQLDNDDDDTTNSNTDIIELQFTPQFVYVSRACGYKSIFENLSVRIIGDESNWILNSEVLNPTVENEDEVHINLFH